MLIHGVINENPRDEGYRQLVYAVGSVAARALLVVRGPQSLSDAGAAIVAKLRPWSVTSRLRSFWPGTELRGTATICEFEVTRQLLDLMANVVGHLYGWEHPDAPEDLAFVRLDGSEILYSIAHEEQAGLTLTPAEAEEVIPRMPLVASKTTFVEQTDVGTSPRRGWE